MLYSLLRSKAEVRVLGVVLFNGGLHLREIARRAGVSAPEAKRELDILERSGVLLKEKRGNQTIISLNPSCPFLPELMSLFSKTEGFHTIIRRAVEGIPGVSFAFIFGSAASGKAREKSDIDVLIIGSVGEELLASALLKAQRKCGSDINYILWSGNDFRRKLREKSAFVVSLLKNPRLWLYGDENEFSKIIRNTRLKQKLL